MEVAFAWAKQIQAPAKRNEVYEQALRLLLWRDREAGRKAVEAAPISDKSKQQLLDNPIDF